MIKLYIQFHLNVYSTLFQSALYLPVCFAMCITLFRLMVTVTHSVPSSLGSSGRNVRFLHAAFNKSGDCFIAGDHHGNIFAFDLVKNRFVLLVLLPTAMCQDCAVTF